MQLFKKGFSYVAIKSVGQLIQGNVYVVHADHKIDNTKENAVVILCHEKHADYEYPFVYRVKTKDAIKALRRLHDESTDPRDLLDDSNSLKDILNYTFHVFPKVFINHNNELILVPKHNVYFRLEGLKDANDFKAKMFAWLSRPISKGLNPKPADKLLYRFNRLLNTQFTMEDMERIYTHLGNDVNPKLTAAFIESNYDMNLLTYDKETT